MPYSPTTWQNNQAPALNATNLNKLKNELASQAAAVSPPISHTLPNWANGVAPALSDATPLNEMERVLEAVANELALSYTPTAWGIGWTPARNATNLNKMEQQAAVNRSTLDTPPGGTVNLVPGNIDNTGVNDVTTALSNWIAGIADGTVETPQILRFTGGTYRIHSMLTVANRSNLIFESSSATLGGNTTLKHTTSVTLSGSDYVGNDSLRMLNFENCTNIKVRYLTLEGASPMPSSPLPTYGMDGFKSWENNVQHIHTLQFDSCVNATVDRVRIWKSGGGDGINWGNQDSGTRTSGIITGCDISDCHRCAIAVVGAQDTLITGNIFGRNGFWVIDLEPNTFTSGNYRITIDGNTFLTNGVISPTRTSVGAFSGSKNGAGECHDLIVRNNVWNNRPAEMHFNIKPYAWGNQITNPDGTVPYPLRIQRLTLTGNTASINGPQIEIRLTDTVNISGNSFGPISDPEIGIHSCTDVHVTGSTFSQDNNDP